MKRALREGTHHACAPRRSARDAARHLAAAQRHGGRCKGCGGVIERDSGPSQAEAGVKFVSHEASPAQRGAGDADTGVKRCRRVFFPKESDRL